VAHACNPSYSGEIRRIVVQSQLRQMVCQTLSQKKKNCKKGLVEWLRVKALSANPSTTKRKKKMPRKLTQPSHFLS
jgi:hypothetical protein